jgi:hypothetical protein
MHLINGGKSAQGRSGTHCGVVRDFEDEFSFGRLPFYAVPRLWEIGESRRGGKMLRTVVGALA